MIGRLLDRYALGLWLRLFGLTVLGFPIVSILINLTDSLKIGRASCRERV